MIDILKVAFINAHNVLPMLFKKLDCILLENEDVVNGIIFSLCAKISLMIFSNTLF